MNLLLTTRVDGKIIIINPELTNDAAIAAWITPESWHVIYNLRWLILFRLVVNSASYTYLLLFDYDTVQTSRSEPYTEGDAWQIGHTSKHHFAQTKVRALHYNRAYFTKEGLRAWPLTNALTWPRNVSKCDQKSAYLAKEGLKLWPEECLLGQGRSQSVTRRVLTWPPGCAAVPDTSPNVSTYCKHNRNSFFWATLTNLSYVARSKTSPSQVVGVIF